MSNETRFTGLNLELPPAPKAMGLYRPLIIVDHLAYLSGHGPLLPDGSLTTGRLGDGMDLDCGYQAARQTGLAMLATLRSELGSLDRIARLVKTLGLVCCTPEYDAQPAVINGFSELMRDVFGEENGIAARSALGTSALPGGIAVEIEAIFELHSEA
ncbi:MAG: RidA family protein [Planctomycetes bacterium]|nr:RidA family protein [Planctomycetota bacterium]